MTMDAAQFSKMKYLFQTMDKQMFLQHYQRDFFNNHCEKDLFELFRNIPSRTYREKMRKQWIVCQKVALRCSAKFCVYIVNPEDHFTGYLALCSEIDPKWNQNILRKIKMPMLEEYAQIYEDCKSQELVVTYLFAVLASQFKEVVFSTNSTTFAGLCFGSEEWMLPIYPKKQSRYLVVQ
ncbi:hypothetical protein [Caproiciproducens galactitolivorans]|uniref:hypothetical protein n=1 Tax=Caproiciproducens galactitolivorans TaxID=642589 RepID=UPI00240A733A|nr:hypothetical protein [Caproiciproducens galactitolivorans]